MKQALHYTNDLCPFAQRAMFARALCKVEMDIVHVPYARQLEFAERWGTTWPATSLGLKMTEKGANAVYRGLDYSALKKIKDEYVSQVNATGEVPALVLPSGSVLTESEVVMEYFAQASRSGACLLPKDPELACRMRLAMKRFNDVAPLLFGLLRNQDPAKDAAIENLIRLRMEGFVHAIDPNGFCIGGQVSLADVHCGPLLYRLDVGLGYWRQFSLRGIHPRIGDLLDAVTFLPEWKSGLVSDEEIIANYEFPSHAARWATDGTGFGGRGRKRGEGA